MAVTDMPGSVKNPFMLRPPPLHNAAGRIATFVHYGSPICLLLAFLAAFAYRGIRLASTVEDGNGKPNDATGQLYGPGGKPLPIRKVTGLQRKKDKAADFSPAKKLVFRWISLFATLTFLASIVLTFVHVFLDRGWWCGEPQVVCRRLSLFTANPSRFT
jgi:ATP-binding cassette, subfamily B, vacuolar membrane transporter HMT1/ACLQ